MKHQSLPIGVAILLCLSPVSGQRQTSLSVEFEDFANSAKPSGGQTSRQDMRGFGRGWSANAHLFWNAPAPVDKPIRNWPHLAVWFEPAGAKTYEVILHYTAAPDFGTFRVFLDGQPRADIDAYSPSVTLKDRSLGQHALGSGKHELLVTVFTKAAASKGFSVGLDRLELAPVVAPKPAGAAGRDGVTGQAGSLTQAVGASMAEGGSTVPVLRIASDAEGRLAATGTIEPLAMAARLSVVQRATSMPLNIPGAPLRLTASSPRVFQRADLKLANGVFSPDALNDGWLELSANGRLTLSFFEVGAQPHLLDCGVKLDAPADIRILPYTKSGTGMHPVQGGSKLSLTAGDQRLLAVLVPEKTSFRVLIEPASGTPFSVRYCELTPFK